MVGSNFVSTKLSSQYLGREFAVSGLELWQWWKASREEAIAAAIPASEVDWLLQAISDLDRLTLRLELFKAQSVIALKLPLPELQQLWQNRVRERVPVQYLAGVAPWRQFLLKVSPAVLIPRPETECLIDLAVQASEAIKQIASPKSAVKATSDSSSHWADLGTGSGAIALGLATEFPDATIHAVDCSEAALAIALTNAENYYLQDRIQFYRGSWLEPLAPLQGQLRGIVSNPPYIPSDLVPNLQPEVSQHEPHLALDGGADGLSCIQHLIKTAPVYLRSGGILLFEMMAGQAIAVNQRLQEQGDYHHIQVFPDLAGIERFALAYRL